jgi:hypothetical protein
MSVRAIKRGAVDFLPKPFRDQDMLDAVMAASGGLPVKVLADAVMVRNTDPTGTAGDDADGLSQKGFGNSKKL